jgi:hypothetical protein
MAFDAIHLFSRRSIWGAIVREQVRRNLIIGKQGHQVLHQLNLWSMHLSVVSAMLYNNGVLGDKPVYTRHYANHE